jgi:hypothetical protein
MWYNRGNKLPVDVTFTEFSPSEKQLVLAGIVLDRRDKIDAANAPAAPRGRTAAATRAATQVPKAVTLRFEALDKTGAVVGSQSVTTEALTPGRSAKFNVTIAAPNAAGYRYTIAG